MSYSELGLAISVGVGLACVLVIGGVGWVWRKRLPADLFRGTTPTWQESIRQYRYLLFSPRETLERDGVRGAVMVLRVCLWVELVAGICGGVFMSLARP
jgi:hypothetical protein